MARRAVSIDRTPSVETRHLVGGRPLRRRLLLARVAEMEQADEALDGGQPGRRPALLAPQHAGGPPVAREAAGVGGEQDDVGGDGGGVQVLLVLDRVAAEDEPRRRPGSGPVELRRALGASGLLQPASVRAERRESARARSGGGWAPSAPARAALASSSRSRGSGRTPCGCGGCGSPSRHPSAHRILAHHQLKRRPRTAGRGRGRHPAHRRGRRSRAKERPSGPHPRA